MFFRGLTTNLKNSRRKFKIPEAQSPKSRKKEMNWKRIPKENSPQPSTGKYSDWKHQLAEEGFHQCVYCALHDATFGERNFHVEHYKPKSIYRFKHLEHVFSNLFYACPVCNVFKGDSWPGAPRKDHSVEAYPDPAKCDYSKLFEDAQYSGQIKG
jgi:5-methylcytosine-specific restriction endonuclease McrA